MAADAEFIGAEGFNLKFKNYLRDFYIYQFKEKGIDFKTKGNKSNLNKIVIDSTFNPDSKRLQPLFLYPNPRRKNNTENILVQQIQT